MYRSSSQQTFMFKTGPILVFLRFHPLTRLTSSFRGIVYSRHRCCICCPSSVSRKSMEVLSFFPQASNPHQSTVWIVSGVWTIVRILPSYSCTRFHHVAVHWSEFLQWKVPAENLYLFQMIRCVQVSPKHLRSSDNSLHESAIAP